MIKEEGHYTIKRVEKLPIKGNANWLYILKPGIVDKFYRWDSIKYEEIQVGEVIGDNSDTTIYLTEDFTLPNSSSFEGILRLKNVSNNTLTINTELLDKLEEENTQELFPDEAFTIKLYQLNDYRVV